MKEIITIMNMQTFVPNSTIVSGLLFNSSLLTFIKYLYLAYIADRAMIDEYLDFSITSKTIHSSFPAFDN